MYNCFVCVCGGGFLLFYFKNFLQSWFMHMVNIESVKKGRIKSAFSSYPWFLFMWFFTSEDTPTLSFLCTFLEMIKDIHI